MQRIGKDPVSCFAAVGVAVEVVDIQAAREGNELGSLYPRGRAEIGLQGRRRGAVRIECGEAAASVVEELTRACSVDLARVSGHQARDTLAGTAPVDEAPITAVDLAQVRVGRRQRGGQCPVCQRVIAYTPVRGDGRLVERVDEEATAVIRLQTQLLDVAGPRGLVIRVHLEQRQEDVVDDLRAVKHVHRDRSGDERRADAQDLVEQFLQRAYELVRVVRQRQRRARAAGLRVVKCRAVDLVRVDDEIRGQVLCAVEPRRLAVDAVGDIGIVHIPDHVGESPLPGTQALIRNEVFDRAV